MRRVLAIVKQRTRSDQARVRDAAPDRTVEAEIEVEDEELIEREEVAVTVTHAGYIKRTPLAEYRVQGRGGKGRSGMATREEDFVTTCSWPRPMHRCCSSPRRAWPTSSRSGVCRKRGSTASGKAMVNLLPLQPGERITTVLPLPEDEAEWEKLNVVFATKSGDVRRNELVRFRQHQHATARSP